MPRCSSLESPWFGMDRVGSGLVRRGEPQSSDSKFASSPFFGSWRERDNFSELLSSVRLGSFGLLSLLFLFSSNLRTMSLPDLILSCEPFPNSSEPAEYFNLGPNTDFQPAGQGGFKAVVSGLSGAREGGVLELWKDPDNAMSFHVAIIPPNTNESVEIQVDVMELWQKLFHLLG